MSLGVYMYVLNKTPSCR